MKRLALVICFTMFCAFLVWAGEQAPPTGQTGAQTSAGPGLPSAPVAASKPAPNSGDELAAKVLAAGLGGFLAWVLTKSVGYWVLRRRLIGYLVVLVNSHLRQYAGNRNWLKAVREKTMKEGHVVKLAAQYTVDELEDLAEVRPDALRLFKEAEIVKLTRFIRMLKELEALMHGFCDILEE